MGVIHPLANMLNLAGDAEFLEASAAYIEILSGGGDPDCAVARKLYERVSGGMTSLNR